MVALPPSPAPFLQELKNTMDAIVSAMKLKIYLFIGIKDYELNLNSSLANL
jgi:hypothetical protein